MAWCLALPAVEQDSLAAAARFPSSGARRPGSGGSPSPRTTVEQDGPATTARPPRDGVGRRTLRLPRRQPRSSLTAPALPLFFPHGVKVSLRPSAMTVHLLPHRRLRPALGLLHASSTVPPRRGRWGAGGHARA
ncbi:unnamed protein product [Urochloa humidicola]